MEDLWIDAIDQYLKGDEWVKVCKSFMDQHCAFFPEGGDKEYTVGQHGIYLEFRQICERVVASVLDRLGCTEEQFAAALREKVERPAAGPRDERVKHVLKTLLAVDDFEAFCKKMEERNKELEEEEIKEIDAKNAAEAKSAAPFQQYYQDHRDKQKGPSESKHESTGALPRGAALAGLEAKASPSPTRGKAGGGRPGLPPGQQQQEEEDEEEGDEEEEEDEDDDGSLPPEWEVQVAAAMSVLEARYRGRLTDEQRALLPWAQAVMSARDEMAREGTSLARVQELEAMVMAAKFGADLAVADAKAARAARSWNVRLHPAQAPEEALAKLIDTSDRLRGAIAKARSKTMYHDEATMTQEKMESIYLFLKDKVQKNKMESDSAEIQNFLKSSLTKKEEKGVGSILLWLHLEKKAGMLEKAIRQAVSGEKIESVIDENAALFAPHDEGNDVGDDGASASGEGMAEDWAEQLDVTSGHLYYLNVATGQTTWEPPACGYKALDKEHMPEYEGWRWSAEKGEWEYTLEEGGREGVGGEGAYGIDLEFLNPVRWDAEDQKQGPAYDINLEDGGGEIQDLELKTEFKEESKPQANNEIKMISKEDAAKMMQAARAASLTKINSEDPNKEAAVSPGPPLGMLPVRPRFLPPIGALLPHTKTGTNLSAVLPTLKTSALAQPKSSSVDSSQNVKVQEEEEEKPLTSRDSTLTNDALRFLMETAKKNAEEEHQSQAPVVNAGSKNI